MRKIGPRGGVIADPLDSRRRSTRRDPKVDESLGGSPARPIEGHGIEHQREPDRDEHDDQGERVATTGNGQRVSGPSANGGALGRAISLLLEWTHQQETGERRHQRPQVAVEHRPDQPEHDQPDPNRDAEHQDDPGR